MIGLTDKISLNVRVAGLNLEHNFLIPVGMSVADATELIVRALCDEYRGVKSTVSKSHALMQASSGRLLPPECSLRQLRIVRGEKMILI